MQAELKLHVKSYQEIKERERQAAEEVKQMRAAEERQQQFIATRETEKFRERVSSCLIIVSCSNENYNCTKLLARIFPLCIMHVRRT